MTIALLIIPLLSVAPRPESRARAMIQVVDEQRKGVPGVVVRWLRSDQPVPSCLALGPLPAEGSGGELTSTQYGHIEVPDEAGWETPVLAHVRAGKLAGMVAVPPEERGAPLWLLPTSDKRVTLSCPGGSCGRIHAGVLVSKDGAACTLGFTEDDVSELVLDSLPSGDATLVVTMNEGQATEARGELKFSVGAFEPLRLALLPVGGTKELRGRVRFKDGFALPASPPLPVVTVECTNGLRRSAEVEAKTGAFVVRNLPEQGCKVSAASSRGAGWSAAPRELRAGQTLVLEASTHP